MRPRLPLTGCSPKDGGRSLISQVCTETTVIHASMSHVSPRAIPGDDDRPALKNTASRNPNALQVQCVSHGSSELSPKMFQN